MFYYFTKEGQIKHVIIQAPNQDAFVEMLKKTFPGEEPRTVEVAEDIRKVTQIPRKKLHVGLEHFLNQNNVLVLHYTTEQDRTPVQHDNI